MKYDNILLFLQKTTSNRPVIGFLFLGCVGVLLVVALFHWKNRSALRVEHKVQDRDDRQEFLQIGGIRNKCYDCEGAGDEGYKSKCFDCAVPTETHSLRHVQETPTTVPKMGYM